MTRSTTAFATFLALLAVSFQFYLQPKLKTAGYYRVGKISDVGIAANGGTGWKCRKVGMANENDKGKEQGLLSACEKLVLHQPSGVLYLACSTPTDRPHWTPTLSHLNAANHSIHTDYLATYDPLTDKITKLNINSFYSHPSRGFSSHGMDVVQSLYDPNDLFIYAVNHRIPKNLAPGQSLGADSSVELFKTKVGSSSAEYLATFVDPAIITPNDIVGNGDGLSFWFTNDNGRRTGWTRKLQADITLGHSNSSVGYCHGKEGCKLAVEGLHSANGIAANQKNGTFYVSDCTYGGITVLERGSSNELVQIAKIPTEYPLDNLALDSEGHLWAAAFPSAWEFATMHAIDPKKPASSAALRISMNTGPGAFYGEKYTVTKEFENNGSLASGTTTVAHDAERKRLFLTGLASPWLTVCDWQQ